MNAVTGFLRAAAREGVELAAATRRFVAERFGDLPDTPENVARIQRAVRRAEPLTANSFNARARIPTRQAQSAGSPANTARRLAEAVQTAQAPSLAARQQRPLAARPTAAPVEQPLALPAPAEPMPSFAAKPRGGQWMTSSTQTPLSAFSPERVARQLTPMGWDNAGVGISRTPELQDWWNRALTRYLQTDFGTPEDPLRELASAAGLADSPEQWSGFARDAVLNVPAGKMAVPVPPVEGAHPLTSTAFAEERAAMPWLARIPATDPIYLLRPDDLPQGALRDIGYEMENALRIGQDRAPIRQGGEALETPIDFAVRPESLNRMTFPQAVERVARIREWRAAQQAAREAERAASAQSNPALRTYREYAEDNPQGLRWVEIAPPEMTEPLEGVESMYYARPQTNQGFNEVAVYRVGDNTNPVEVFDAEDGEDGLSAANNWIADRRPTARQAVLQDALSYEGDTMGHCVGNYCDDVLSGNARIFSLRDPAGQPFVTVETRPRSQTFSDLVAHLGGDRVAADDYFAQGFQARDAAADSRSPLAHALELAGVPPTQDIIQIKGSGKRQGQQQLRLSSRGYEDGPDDYLLPFVQDFVRQGQFGNVGDIANTGLTRLPDGRYITLQQAEEGIAAIPETSVPMQFGLDNTAPTMMPRVYDPTALDRLAPEEWEGLSQYFQGYAIGGRVDPERCFTRHRLSVKR